MAFVTSKSFLHWWDRLSAPEQVSHVVKFANGSLPELGDPDSDAYDERIKNLWTYYFAKVPGTDHLIWSSVDIYKDQAQLRSLLKSLTCGRSNAVLRHIKEPLGNLHISVIVSIVGDRKAAGLSQWEQPEFLSIAQWFSAVLLALIMSGSSARLRNCADQGCQKYFFDPPRRGRTMKFCCKQHEDRTNKRLRRQGP